MQDNIPARPGKEADPPQSTTVLYHALSSSSSEVTCKQCSMHNATACCKLIVLLQHEASCNERAVQVFFLGRNLLHNHITKRLTILQGTAETLSHKPWISHDWVWIRLDSLKSRLLRYFYKALLHNLGPHSKASAQSHDKIWDMP